MVTSLKHPKLVANNVNCVALRENGVLPVSKMTKAPFPSILTSYKGLLQEESKLPTVRTSDGFDPDIYKLLEESGYDFSKPPSPGYVIDAKPDGPNGAKNGVEIGWKNFCTKDCS